MNRIIFPNDVTDYLKTLQDEPPSIPLTQLLTERAELAFGRIRYSIDIWNDARKERNLPPVKSILDIGCGFALIDIHLARLLHCNEFHLIDGSSDGNPPRRREKYHAEQTPWNNVMFGYSIVKANVPDSFINVYTPGLDDISSIPSNSIDLVISLRAWGHHFPIAMYVDLVKRCITDAGLLILDIRNGTDGQQVLEQAGFVLVEQIPDHSVKCRRLAFRKR